MKKGTTAICLLLAAMLLTGCGGQKTEDPAPAGTQAAGAGETAAESRRNIPLADKVRSAAADAETLLPLTAEDLSDDLGIEETDYDEFVFLQSTGMDGREILAIRAKNTEAAGKIAAAMETYLGRRRNEARNYAPEAYELLTAAGVQTRGRTVALIVGKDAGRETETVLAGE